MQVSSEEDLNDCDLDSSQFIGVIGVSKDEIVKEQYASREDALKRLKAEIKTLSQYTEGEVYHYSLEKVVEGDCPTCKRAHNNEHVESLCGIYPSHGVSGDAFVEEIIKDHIVAKGQEYSWEYAD